MTRFESGVMMALSIATANVAASQDTEHRASSGANRDTLSPRCDSARSALRMDPTVLAGIRETLDANDGMVVRWPRGRDETIRVWVQPRSLSMGSLINPMASTRAVWRAMSAWSGNAGPRLGATVDSATADVHVVWAPVLSPRADRPATRPAARTTIRGVRATGVITGALVEIRETRSTGVPFGADELYAIALHETGHVIGLKHRADKDAFMTSGMRAGTLTAADIALARAWYALPVGAVCRSAASVGPKR